MTLQTDSRVLCLLQDMGLPVCQEQPFEPGVIPFVFVTRFKPDQTWLSRHPGDSELISSAAERNDGIPSDFPSPVVDAVLRDGDKEYLAVYNDRLPDTFFPEESLEDFVQRRTLQFHQKNFYATHEKVQTLLCEDTEKRFDALIRNRPEDFESNRKTALMISDIVYDEAENLLEMTTHERKKHDVFKQYARALEEFNGDKTKAKNRLSKTDFSLLAERSLLSAQDIDALDDFVFYVTGHNRSFDMLLRYQGGSEKCPEKCVFPEEFIRLFTCARELFETFLWKKGMEDAFTRHFHQAQKKEKAKASKKKLTLSEKAFDALVSDLLKKHDIFPNLLELKRNEAHYGVLYDRVKDRKKALSEPLDHSVRLCLFDLKKPTSDCRPLDTLTLHGGILPFNEGMHLSLEDINVIKKLNLFAANVLRAAALIQGRHITVETAFGIDPDKKDIFDRKEALYHKYTHQCYFDFSSSFDAKKRKEVSDSYAITHEKLSAEKYPVQTPPEIDYLYISHVCVKDAVTGKKIDLPEEAFSKSRKAAYAAATFDIPLEKDIVLDVPSTLDPSSRLWANRICQEGAGTSLPLFTDMSIKDQRRYSAKMTHAMQLSAQTSIRASKRQNILHLAKAMENKQIG